MTIEAGGRPFGDDADDACLRAVDVLAAFEPIALNDLGRSALLDRVDTKYVLPIAMLPALLARSSEHYRALEVAGRRMSRYVTTYFDSPSLRLYHAHHAGRATRSKLRTRVYADTATRLIEIKHRDNKGRTTKHRFPLSSDAGDPLSRLHEFPVETRAGITRDLAPALETSFLRATLVRRVHAERVTIDLSLRYLLGAEAAEFPALAFVEVKQEQRGPSPIFDLLREFRVQPGSISKYCLGIATLHPSAKRNRFKPAMLRLHRIARDPVAAASAA
jgi:hypothetical protein